MAERSSNSSFMTSWLSN